MMKYHQTITFLKRELLLEIFHKNLLNGICPFPSFIAVLCCMEQIIILLINLESPICALVLYSIHYYCLYLVNIKKMAYFAGQHQTGIMSSSSYFFTKPLNHLKLRLGKFFTNFQLHLFLNFIG